MTSENPDVRWSWCWLIGHHFAYIKHGEITGKPVYHCTRCLKIVA